MFGSLVLPRNTPDRRRRRAQVDIRVASAVPTAPRDAAPTLIGHVEEYEKDIERVLITADEIEATLRRLGAQITTDYRGQDLLLVGVLKGAFLTMSDLSRHIRLPLELDFMAVSSYGAATQTSGVVRILKDLDHEIEGRNVLVVEDIVDSGLTLSYLLKMLRTRRPESLEVCTLLHKSDVQQVELDIRYVGFEIPPVFVVGYGLDFAERFRNLPYVATLKPEAYRDAVT
jgi:hypoxanthine phosphoribosyltransferase